LQKLKKKKKCWPEKRGSSPRRKGHWNEIKKKDPKAKIKETSNIVKAKWKRVGAMEKKPYEKKGSRCL